MKLNLEALDLLDELANHGCISKLESKLPMMISNDWSKDIIKGKLNRKPSNEKFSLFFEFLNDNKKRIDYLVSQNSAGGCAKGTAQNFVVGMTYTARTEQGNGHSGIAMTVLELKGKEFCSHVLLVILMVPRIFDRPST